MLEARPVASGWRSASGWDCFVCDMIELRELIDVRWVASYEWLDVCVD